MRGQLRVLLVAAALASLAGCATNTLSTSTPADSPSPRASGATIYVEAARANSFPAVEMYRQGGQGARVDLVEITAGGTAHYVGSAPEPGQPFRIVTRVGVAVREHLAGPDDTLSAVEQLGGRIEPNAVINDDAVPLDASRLYVVVSRPTTLSSSASHEVMAAFPVEGDKVFIQAYYSLEGLGSSTASTHRFAEGKQQPGRRVALAALRNALR